MRLDDMSKFRTLFVEVEPKDPFDDPVGLCCAPHGNERDSEEDLEEEDFEEEEEEDFDDEDLDDEEEWPDEVDFDEEDEDEDEDEDEAEDEQ